MKGYTQNRHEYNALLDRIMHTQMHKCICNGFEEWKLFVMNNMRQDTMLSDIM